MTTPAWFKSSYSDSSGGDCVEVAVATAIRIRDSKTPNRPYLTVSPTAWTNFLTLASRSAAGHHPVRDHRGKLHDPPTPAMARAGTRDQSRRTPGPAAAGRLLVLIAAPILPALLAFAVGRLMAAFTVRESPSETGVRRRLEARSSRS